jgi:hypothetical protein
MQAVMKGVGVTITTIHAFKVEVVAFVVKVEEVAVATPAIKVEVAEKK